MLVPSVTVITFDDQGRVLLVKHADAGVWVAPGGSLDPHESPADAAVREMWEETGLRVEPTRVLGVYGGPEFHVRYAKGTRSRTRWFSSSAASSAARWAQIAWRPWSWGISRKPT